jgi:predicted regulator of Ras-like GTPase activity (Roadblock/LC7/MglB family)
MANSGMINKGKFFDLILSKIIRKMSAGSVMLLNNDGLKIAEKTCGMSDSDAIWGSANRLLSAGERAVAELRQEKGQFNQIFESENFLLMVGPVNQDISYAILSSKLNKISLGMLKMFAQTLREQVKTVDNSPESQ